MSGVRGGGRQLEAATASRVACAVITVPIGHDDTRSLVARSANHVEAGFVVLSAAHIRRNLRDSLGGAAARCHRENCSRHRWFRYTPSPNWKLPTDEAGLRDVHACTARRVHGGGLQCRRGSQNREPPQVLREAARQTRCDGMHRLYWSTHEY